MSIENLLDDFEEAKNAAETTRKKIQSEKEQRSENFRNNYGKCFSEIIEPAIENAIETFKKKNYSVVRTQEVEPRSYTSASKVVTATFWISLIRMQIDIYANKLTNQIEFHALYSERKPAHNVNRSSNLDVITKESVDEFLEEAFKNLLKYS